MEPGFNSNDLGQIEKRGIDQEKVLQQIDIFRRGNISVNLSEAATLKNGIKEFSAEEKLDLQKFFEDEKEQLDLLKFVPASGAATRMFKSLYTFLDEYDPQAENLDDYLDRGGKQDLATLFNGMENLPFYEEVKASIANYGNLGRDEQRLQFVKKMLREDGMNLGDFPKGLVPFHRYPEGAATAFEEHLKEAADYAASRGIANLHFTIAREHQAKFEAELERVKPKLEQETGLEYKVSYSFQDPRTDTIAVDLKNEPFRDDNGNLFFRPGGHGALLENLNNQEADIIFIKNIDNVVTPRHRKLVAEYKKLLAGKLLQLQRKTFGFQEILEKPQVPEEVLEEIREFAQEDLNISIDNEFGELPKEEKITHLKKKLHRPMRICGMVKNEGEPGGGPFWVRHKTGDVSLQIVESSQIDSDNYQQSQIAQEATHFNPVDIVCGIRDHKGKKFELSKYVDPDTSFISSKTKDGKELKALEHPGLWNGGMADWVTVFVEVPVETFNPVKTVSDLLKPTHQVR